MKELDIQPCMHILDCTKLLVNLDDSNYENSSVAKIDGESMRGYKLGVLRGILGDSGIVEEIVSGTLKTHDIEQCREMLQATFCFHENDILINDRRFLSRDMANYLKTVRKAEHGGLQEGGKAGHPQREMTGTPQPEKEGPGDSAGDGPRPVLRKR